MTISDDSNILEPAPISEKERRRQIVHAAGIVAAMEGFAAQAPAYADALRHDIRRKEVLAALRCGRDSINVLIAALEATR